jgi:hypothetical protein
MRVEDMAGLSVGRTGDRRTGGIAAEHRGRMPAAGPQGMNRIIETDHPEEKRIML